MNKDVLRLVSVEPLRETYTEGGRTIRVRAFKNIIYCANPVDAIQKMNIFVPEAYYNGGAINGYTKETAPIFMPNAVGGYLPGIAMEPGTDHLGELNSVFRALEHGLVVACAGVRGRTTGKKSDEFFEGSDAAYRGEETGAMVGRAPALIVDMKAAIRYLRHNKDVLPGDTEKIITNGTSAGGALSALCGASGNVAEYQPYLTAIGAADERDDIFAASCYCPIHNLENADAAYEWQFGGENKFFMMQPKKTETGLIFETVEGELSEEQKSLSKDLSESFPSYVNRLGLKNESGVRLSLEADGNGSFKDYIKGWLFRSAQRETDLRESGKRHSFYTIENSAPERQGFIHFKNGRVLDIAWKGYINAITRMKPVPAFDALDLSSPENEEFGDENCDGRHFNRLIYEKDDKGGELADEKILRLMNPVSFIRDSQARKAPYWRIRHGTYDRDTSIAIPVILQLLLKNEGYDVDFFMPWGTPHRGDYDLDDLFAWIDTICLK